METTLDMFPLLEKLGENTYTVSGANLVPGFHFCPTDLEIFSYLRHKNKNHGPHFVGLIPEIDVYAYNGLPGELLNYLPSRELLLHFFCPVARKSKNGSKKNRSSKVGNWHISGKDRIISDQVQIVGKVKTLVFYEGNKKKTNWMMHEYTLLDLRHSVKKSQTDSDKDEYVLYKLFDSEDNQQTGASSRKSECTDYAYKNSIIPESHMGIFYPKFLVQKTSNNECASSIPGNTDDPGTSGVENLTEHGLPLEEVETEVNDPFSLQDNDATLEDETCTSDNLMQHSDMFLEDDLLNLPDTDQDPGISISERHNSCPRDSQYIEKEPMGTSVSEHHSFPLDSQHIENELMGTSVSEHHSFPLDSQHIEKELMGTSVSEHHSYPQDCQHFEKDLMDFDVVDGDDNFFLHDTSQKVHVPTFVETQYPTHVLPSWINDGNVNGFAESPFLTNGGYLSDVKIDECGWVGYGTTSGYDTFMGDSTDVMF